MAAKQKIRTAKLKIKKGDRVMVQAGRDKGKSGQILATFPAQNRAIVQGVNMVKRHTRQTQQDAGGIVSREAKIHVSNLALIDPKDAKATRIGYTMAGDKKIRVSKRSGEAIDG